MTKITVLQEAEQELLEAVGYYESKCPGLGMDFLGEVESGMDMVGNMPTIWPLREDGTRRYLVHRFPYLVIYVHHEDHVWIIAFAHCKRKPGYWRERARASDSVHDGEK